MRFKVGDKVRVREDLQTREYYGESNLYVNPYMEDFLGKEVIIERVYGDRYTLLGDERSWEWNDEMLEPIDDPLVKKIEERNNKPVKMILGENLLNESDPIKPSHYKTGDKDLFDELYDRLYHSKKMFTGREVFIIVMKFVAERYTRRYPNKNAEDLSKGIYTLERLRGYEEMEEEHETS